MDLSFSSTSTNLQPWLGEAIQLAAPSRGERVLQVTGQSLAQTRALLDLVGDKGKVLLVESDRSQAEMIRELEHPALAVLAHDPEEGESFGLFDALFACPLRMPASNDRSLRHRSISAHRRCTSARARHQRSRMT